MSSRRFRVVPSVSRAADAASAVIVRYARVSATMLKANGRKRRKESSLLVNDLD
jgi:hypothetical protein